MIKRTGLLLAVFLGLSLLAAAQEVAVAAAADLQFALKDIADRFQRETGNSVRTTFGSSGNFSNQIENGAPFDIFFSADLSYPEQLQKAGLVEPGSFYHYANGRIVLWTRNPHVDLKRGLAVLLDPAIRKIAIANPQHAPYGRAAVAAMQHENVYEKIRSKLVLGESVSQAAQFVDSGNADVGIIALSLAVAPAMRSKGRYLLIPENEYPAIQQGCVILKSARHKAVAQRFLAFIKRPDTSETLKKFGFATPRR